MKILTSLFGGAGFDTIRRRGSRRDRELPMAELYGLLWAYYYNNGLYEALRSAGYYLSNSRLKELYNPAFRSAEFFVDTLWPGPLETAIPIVTEDSASENLIPAIEQVWNWSNWGRKKNVAVRWLAVTGNVFFRVARPRPRPGQPEAEEPKRVYIQLIRPEYVTEQEVDERDYITYCRLDIPEIAGRGRSAEPYTHTEIWEPERLRIWFKDDKKAAEELGAPDYEVALAEWGLDFIPIVNSQLLDVGETEGAGAFTLALEKINELNRIATRLHQMLYRHNNVTWALEANMLDPSGRPLPAPRVAGSNTPGDTEDVVELGDEKFLRLPGMAKLVPLVPNLNYTAQLDALQAQMEEIERDLPQLVYYKLKDLSEMSGRALRLLLTPALGRATEARGNLDMALIRAHKMALTIGQKIGAFEGMGLGTYEQGAFDHRIAERPFIRMSREEVAELAGLEVGAGIPLRVSLKNSGWTDEQLEKLEEEKAKEQEAQQSTLASALLNAQAGAGAGQASNGMEQPAVIGAEPPQNGAGGL